MNSGVSWKREPEAVIEVIQHVNRESPPAYIFYRRTMIDFGASELSICYTGSWYNKPDATYESGMARSGPYVHIKALNRRSLSGFCFAKMFPLTLHLEGAGLGYVDQNIGFSIGDLGNQRRNITSIELSLIGKNMLFTFELKIAAGPMMQASSNSMLSEADKQTLDLRYVFDIPYGRVPEILKMDRVAEEDFARYHKFSYLADSNFQLTSSS